MVGVELTDHEELRSLRQSDWAGRSDRGIEVFTYEQGMQVLDHPDLRKGPSFQYRLDKLGISGEARRYMDMGITNKEDEERRQMRASMGALFRPSQIAKLRDAVRGIAHATLDEMGSPDGDDLMRLCWQIPAQSYCELVSVPYSEADTVIRIAESVLGALLKVDRSRREEAESAIFDSIAIVRKHLDARRGSLGDDFTSVMIRQQESGLMTEDQLLAQSFALLQASVDNTAHQMGNTFGMLLANPERWDALVREPSLREPVIEEAIRLYPRFGTIFRLAARDTVVDDLEIPEGTWVFVSTRSGQRDPSVFSSPDEYRLDRLSRRPLMFGAGPYNCLGQGLARLEVEEALKAVAERFPRIRLTGDWSRSHANAVSETLSIPVEMPPEVERARSVQPAQPAVEPVPETVTAPPESTGPDSAVARPQDGEAVIDAEVTGLVRATKNILTVELQARDGADLPEWEPGAHIDVLLPEGRVRQYSLCGSKDDRRRYRIAVLNEPDGAGGSRYVHESLTLGQHLEVHGPRNNFQLQDAPAYHFVAGGIGITPILPMVREASRRKADWTFVYLGRGERDMAFLEELGSLDAGRIRVIDTQTTGRPDTEEIVAGAAPGAFLYACGPTGLLSDLAGMSWDEDSLHFERFEPDIEALEAEQSTFTAELTQSKLKLEVSKDKTLLEAMEDAGVDWPFSCREGTCGSCEVRIIAGAADHRDAILTPPERRSNETMMVCVSRADGEQISIEA